MSCNYIKIVARAESRFEPNQWEMPFNRNFATTTLIGWAQTLNSPGSRCSWGYRDQSVYASSQWETTLHCNIISHWMDECAKPSLELSSWYPVMGPAMGTSQHTPLPIIMLTEINALLGATFALHEAMYKPMHSIHSIWLQMPSRLQNVS